MITTVKEAHRMEVSIFCISAFYVEAGAKEQLSTAPGIRREIKIWESDFGLAAFFLFYQSTPTEL